MTSPWLATDDLHRHYARASHQVRALDGVTLAVEAGELLAVVGASGSGKTTLLNLLAGLDTPTAGTITVAGRREIGILKSLGADEHETRLLFLVESAVIGAAGSAIGIALSWAGTRAAAAIMAAIMRREEIPVFDPFVLPACG